MKDELKVAAVLGTLGLTGIVAYAFRDRFGASKTASGPISQSSDTWDYVYVYQNGSAASTNDKGVPNDQVADKDRFWSSGSDTITPLRQIVRVRTSDGYTVTVWSSSKTSSGPGDPWNYIYTYADGTTWTDPTPSPSGQVSMTDGLVPDTAKAAHAVKVERRRMFDGYTVVVWSASADKTSSGPPAVSTLMNIQSVLLPWQIQAAANYRATHPNFGNDWQEVIRVLAITPAQIAKANAAYKPFAAADAVAAASAPDSGSQWSSAPVTQAADGSPWTESTT